MAKNEVNPVDVLAALTELVRLKGVEETIAALARKPPDEMRPEDWEALKAAEADHDANWGWAWGRAKYVLDPKPPAPMPYMPPNPQDR